MSTYRQADAKYPWLSSQYSNGVPFKFVMTNTRSESWYGKAVEGNAGYLNLIKPGDRIIDCGANEGYTSILAALKAGPSGQVLAIEPAAHNQEPLKINIAINNLSHRIGILQAAVGETESVTGFAGERVSGTENGVSVVTLDSLCHFKPDVIKIDIEGFEVRAFRGGRKLLTECRPTIFLEPHLQPEGVDMRQYGDTPEELYQLVTELGYLVYRDDVVIDHIPAGAVVLHHKLGRAHWPLKTLCYTVAYGEDAWRQAGWMVKGLRRFGMFTDEIRVYSDREGFIDGATVINAPQLAGVPIPKMHKSVIGMHMDVRGFDRVMFIDADISIVNPVAPIIALPGTNVAVEHFLTADPGSDWFALPGDEWKPGDGAYNSGTIVADADEWNGICAQWYAKLREVVAWNNTAGVDQPALNHLIKSGRLEAKPLPREWIHFFTDESFSFTPQTIGIHHKHTNKVPWMRLVHEMRESYEHTPR